MGCGREEAGDDAGGPRSARRAERTARHGPVEVTLSVDRAEPAPGQAVTVVVAVVAERGVTVHVEDYERVLTAGDRRFECRIVDATETLERDAGDSRLRWTYTYAVEFVLPGEFELPPVVVRYVDERAATGQAAGGTGGSSALGGAPLAEEEVTTEALPIVVGAPAGGPLANEELKRIDTPAPVELPGAWDRWAWIITPVVVLGLACAVWLVYRIRRQRDAVVVVVPAHVWARREIAALVADDLVARGRVQDFHYRLSAIMRGYIERRFAIAAPEMTTEEFLDAAARDTRFSSDHAACLRGFLTACDLVKYARHQPAHEECDVGLRTADAFIEQTREVTGPDGARVERAGAASPVMARAAQEGSP
ncbi:MAG: hypothetical protein ACE5E6_07065 [Phycisphaerae bacterium]